MIVSFTRTPTCIDENGVSPPMRSATIWSTDGPVAHPLWFSTSVAYHLIPVHMVAMP